MPLDIPPALQPVRMRIRAKTHEVLAQYAEFRSVFNARTVALRRPQLPAVRIYILSDAWENGNRAHDLGWFLCTATLTVQIITEAGSDPDTADYLDYLASLAQHALVSDHSWRKLIQAIDSITTSIAFDEQGEQRTAQATIEMQIRYADCAERDYGTWGDGDPHPEWSADYKRLRLKIDVKDPAADPNTGPEGTPPNVEDGYKGGYPGPDGRIEVDMGMVFDTE